MNYKIAIILGKFPSLSETFIINQINGLVDSGNDVTIYSYNRGDINDLHKSLDKHDLLSKVHFKDAMPSSKIERFLVFFKVMIKNYNSINWYYLLNSLNFVRHGKEALSLQLFYQSYWFHKKADYDILHAHFGPIGVHVAKLIEKGFFKNSKFIVTLHGFDLTYNFIEEHKEDYLLLNNQADIITVNTSYSQTILKNIFPALDKVRILPVGLDTSFFKPSPNNIKNKFTILYCGRLVPFKASDIAIKIFKQLVLSIEN
jgi:colanic acid/amylovoran biosynthesis glycosyltransferase